MVKTFFEALKNENPLKIVGCINPFTALLAEKSGLKGKQYNKQQNSLGYTCRNRKT